MQDLTYLLQHCTTDNQRSVIKKVNELGNMRAAAKDLSVNESTVRRLVCTVKARAGVEGSVPELNINNPFPGTGNIAKGYSRYFKADDGGYWIKTDVPLQQRLEIAEAAIDALKEDIKPTKITRRTGGWKQPAELLDFYVLSDIHLGALSWGEESGSDWDIKIAEDTIVEAFQALIERSEPAQHGFLCQLGDALHYDSMIPVTPTSAHIIDSDSRPHKMVRSTIRVFRRVIDMLLSKHDKVTVLHAAGNHDPFGSIWLQESFSALYEKNDRCHVIVNPSPYYAFKHGKTFLGCHHGHKAKLQKLVDIFNGRQYWQMKSDCTQAYIHSGHEHHHELKECNGAIVEMHPTLAARSSYEVQGGYDAVRAMNCITYHDSGKEHCRQSWYPQ